MKKRVVLLVILVLLILPSINVNAASKANTLAELRQELKDYKAKQTANNNKKKATEAEISNAKSNVSSKQSEITANQQKITESIAESEKLEVEIENGKTELAKIIKNYQLSNSDNIYLEYIFGADSYENLIYRYAVMEQVMNYQNDKITAWKEKIEYNNQLKIDLEKREETLNKQIDSLSKEIASLNSELEDYFDITLSIQEEIKSTEALIKTYEDMGCKENQSIQECINMTGDTHFIRPLVKGTITSVWGYRTHPVTGKANTFHNGIDIGGNAVGTSVYSAANGMVGKIINKSSCGGNQVYIYHTINGKKYTTTYLHLNSINVKLGQKITNQTVIGTVGGQKGTYDTCTTGAHLHFGMGTGWYGSDYTSSATFKANSVNPATMINFPAPRKYFYSRT